MTSQQQKQEFIYFETFYKIYRETFKKPADSLFLFIHWFMLKNSYQSTFNNIKSEILPENWNSNEEYYDIFYQRGTTRFRLEVYLIHPQMHIQLKRLSDCSDSLQHITITDYINEDDYNNIDYKLSLKNLDKFYIRMHKCIAYAKDILTPSSSDESIFHNSDKENENCVKIKNIQVSSKEDMSIANETNYNIEIDSGVLQNEELKKKEKEENLRRKKALMVECSINLNCLKMNPLYKEALEGKNRITLTDEMISEMNGSSLKKMIINENKMDKPKTVNQTLDSFFVLKSTPSSDNSINSRLRNSKRKRSSVSSESNSSSINTKKLGKTIIDDDDNDNDNEGLNNETMKLIDDTIKRIDEDEIQVLSPEHTKVSRKSKEINKENII